VFTAGLGVLVLLSGFTRTARSTKRDSEGEDGQ